MAAAEYQVRLDVFSGPLDLLLYLIRRDELDVQDIPIARVTEQYVEYVRLLEQIDPNAAGDFLVMAATLVELKSRALLPTPPLEADDDEDDPRAVLVRQLLEYKRFKDAARKLGSAAEDQARRYVRRPAELPVELDGVELEEAEIWDLLSAFGRVMASIGRGPGRYDVRYDDTPVALYAAELIATLESEGPTTFEALFSGRERAEVIGLFLALLELIRQRRVSAEQDRAFDRIYLFLLEEAPLDASEPGSEAAAADPVAAVDVAGRANETVARTEASPMPAPMIRIYHGDADEAGEAQQRENRTNGSAEHHNGHAQRPTE